MRSLVLVALLGCGSSSHPAVGDGPPAPDAPVDVAIDAPHVAVQTYVKASDTAAGDRFGATIAVASDGQTFVVGAPGRATQTGAAYVFVKQQGMWSQQAILTASNADTGDQFGWSAALSSDGNTLAVGAYSERSCATGIDGDQTSNACAAGAVYVLVRAGTAWTQQAYVKASNTTYNDGNSRFFGQSVALSADGNTLAVGDPGDSSNATGLDGDPTNISMSLSGAVFVFTRAGATWSQQAYVKASNTGANDDFGNAVALSASGDAMVVGAGGEDSAATGVDGSQVDNSLGDSGAAYVFGRTGTTWAQQAYLKASNTGHNDAFGYGLAISGDGATVAVGAPGEASGATGINGDQTDDSQLQAGAVYAFGFDGSQWSQQAYVKEQGASLNADYFGYRIALSHDGTTLAGGAELAQAPLPMGNGVMQSGAAYEYARTGAAWATGSAVRASNADNDDIFGGAVGLSGDASLLVVGAPGEASAATGINGNAADNSANAAGAVYVVE